MSESEAKVLTSYAESLSQRLVDLEAKALASRLKEEKKQASYLTET